MKPLILIIDDSELILQMLTMICAQAGYRSVTCHEFAAVAPAVEAEVPALILSDLNLPDLGGRDPVSALRAIDGLAQTPIVLISGIDPEALRQKAEALGADGALSKEAGMPGMMSALPPLIASLIN